ncbi:head-tail connector protein [Plasticicumulans acidivorans]|uniref:Putative phiE125 gp8 family phage protein n=1 Tax=Plasticicumulans acidivorans TaxID=886464 RepID=A0A317N161_9GAMM|nr:phage head-tail connector protein [Plasticicumulans acidivorans]PWV66003.1 putative phiE125 gp8 family phage protein [Plasticicumulans acidivorans]
MSLLLVTPPACLPLDLETAKLHARIDGTDRDIILSGSLAAAVAMVEAATRRALIAQGWRQIELAPCASITLARWPVLELLTVGDERGALVEGEDYTVTGRGPDAVSVAPVFGWQGEVVIEYRAGYGESGADVPAPLVSAVALRFVALIDIDQEPACRRAAEALEAPYWVPRL